jgi:hypothetical protein
MKYHLNGLRYQSKMFGEKMNKSESIIVHLINTMINRKLLIVTKEVHHKKATLAYTLSSPNS